MAVAASPFSTAAGRPYIADVKEGDLWYFPAGFPHSLQGLAPDGCEFLLCFDEGHASEYSTLLLTDWFAHTPPKHSGRELRGFRPRRFAADFRCVTSTSSKAICPATWPLMVRR